MHLTIFTCYLHLSLTGSCSLINFCIRYIFCVNFNILYHFFQLFPASDKNSGIRMEECRTEYRIHTFKKKVLKLEKGIVAYYE